MLTTPHCFRLNDLMEIHNQLLKQIMEKYVNMTCRDMNLETSLCVGDYLFLASVESYMPEGVNMAVIAKTMQVHPSTATRQVNRLLGQKLITKTIVPEDERRFMIQLTTKGKEFLDSISLRIKEGVKHTYSNVTDEETEAVFSFLLECIDRLKEILSGDLKTE